MSSFYADAKHQKMVITLFKRLIEHNRSIRDKESVAMAFKHVLSRAMPTKKEMNACEGCRRSQPLIRKE